MQTIKITGQPGDEIALEYNGATLVVKLSDDAIVPDFIDVLMRALRLDSHGVARLCIDYYHRYTTPDEAFLPRLATIRDRLFDSLTPSEADESEQPEESATEAPESEEQSEESATDEPESAPKSAKKTRKTSKET